MTEQLPHTLAAWLQKIEALHPVKWDLGLERVSQVAQRLGVQRPAPRTVLVAGTNGKGSTCEYLTAIAKAAGVSVGTSTSPHLHRFNERIRLDGEPVADQTIVRAFAAIERARAATSLTYFEFSTLASLLIFAEAGVELALLEIGLGGRLDAMNLVEPDLAIITSISLDHEAWLGTGREAIGREKAGILRPGKPCVLADPEPPASILAQAEQLGAPLLALGKAFMLEEGTLSWQSATGERQSVASLPSPKLPQESLAAAVQAAALLGMEVPPARLRQLAQQTQLAGRGQLLPGSPDLLLDVAHNPAAAARLAQQLAGFAAQGRDIHALAGIYADKDLPQVLGPLAPLVKSWFFCDLPEQRAASAQQLAETLACHYHLTATSCASIEEGLSLALGGSKPEDLLLVFGSFPVVAGALQAAQANIMPVNQEA